MNEKSRPEAASQTPAKKSDHIVAAPGDNKVEHGAIVAVDATMYLHRFAWEQAVHRAVALGETFSADELQAEHDLPEIGNATGGVFMSFHRAGVIEKVGWKASTKPSRAGSIVTIWTGTKAAA